MVLDASTWLGRREFHYDGEIAMAETHMSRISRIAEKTDRDRVITSETLYREIDRSRFGISFIAWAATVCMYSKDEEKNALQHDYRSTSEEISKFRNGVIANSPGEFAIRYRILLVR